MSRDQQRLLDYLNHISEAIVRIEHYVEDLDENDFLNNALIQDAVVRNLEVIGEASNKIQKFYPAFTEQHTEIPFSVAYEMRNALSHGYFKINFEVVWQTLERDLPELSRLIAPLLIELRQ